MKLNLKGALTALVISGLLFSPGVLTRSAAAAELNGWQVSDLNAISDPVKTPQEVLVESLLGSGVTVSNVKYTGTKSSAGTFQTTDNIIGFNEGVVLSTGSVSSVIGPNKSGNTSGYNGLPGDSDLAALISGVDTQDATVLDFDFIPTTDTISFQYVFASDEYNEYANTSYNDVFGFFLNGKNVAKLPDGSTIVAINNVNGGNPLGTNAKNPLYFRNNWESTTPLNTEMDGLTVVLSVYEKVNVGQLNHIKLAIADVGDNAYDSNVFIKANSFTTKPNTPPTALDDKAAAQADVPVKIDVLANDSDADGDQLMVTKVSNGTNGTVSLEPNGTAVAYTPNAGFVGTDTFTYTISDGKGGTATAQVEVTVSAAESKIGSIKGGGAIATAAGGMASFAYSLNSSYIPAPNSLELSWDQGSFKLSTLNSLTLISAPTANYGKGTGSGTYNGVPGAAIEFLFSDSLTGDSDTAVIIVKDAEGNVVLSATGSLSSGDNSAYIW